MVHADLFADIDRLEATLADSDTTKSATIGEPIDDESSEEHVSDHSEVGKTSATRFTLSISADPVRRGGPGGSR